MKERKATPIRLQATAQVIPAVDGMHGFVLNDLFQQMRGRAPVNAAHLQKTGVEPRREQVQQVCFYRLPLAVFFQTKQQVTTQAYQRSGSAGRSIEPAKQFLSWRFGGCGKRRQGA